MANDLKHQLMQEAEAMLPAFDESLHERTMQRVNRARRDNLAAAVLVPTRMNPAVSWFVRGAVALLLVGVGAGIWVSMDTDRDRIDARSAVEFNQALASLGQTAKPLSATLHLPVRTAQHQLVLLKEDAATLGAFVTGQVRNLSMPIDTSKLPS